MATAHTDGAPPSRGITILANMGCTENSSMADTNSVDAKAYSTSAREREKPRLAIEVAEKLSTDMCGGPLANRGLRGN
jgi:hypothetical protein